MRSIAGEFSLLTIWLCFVNALSVGELSARPLMPLVKQSPPQFSVSQQNLLRVHSPAPKSLTEMWNGTGPGIEPWGMLLVPGFQLGVNCEFEMCVKTLLVCLYLLALRRLLDEWFLQKRLNS